MSMAKAVGWFLACLLVFLICAFVVRSNGFLLWSVRHDFAHLARLSLLAGADPNAGRDSRTALMEASSRADTCIVGALLDRGAVVGATDRDDRQALHYAARNAQTDGSVVALLLSHGGNPVASSKEGVTPLMLATSELSGGTSMNAIAMISYAPEVNQQDSDGNTALWIATTEAETEVFLALLRAGADPNLSNKKGGLPITIAASNGLADRVKLLLRFDADPFLKAHDAPSANEIVRGAAPNPELKAKFQEIAQIIDVSRRGSH